jgi:hypothetical protein
MSNLFSGLITSQTRIKLLVRFFINAEARAYLRELARDFNISTNGVREELNQLVSSKLLMCEKIGRQVFYSANQDHPLYPELKSMVGKIIGIDKVVGGIVNRLGELEEAYLIDDYALGKDTGIIDLVLIGNIDRNQLDDLSRKTERYIKRKIRTLILTREESLKFFDQQKSRPKLRLWSSK